MKNASTFSVYSNDTGKRLTHGLQGDALVKFIKKHGKEQGKRQEYTVIESHRPIVKVLGKFKTKHTALWSNGTVKFGRRTFSN